ncbi:histidine kinase [Thermoplasmatales archaeon SW_10_69_26]|nr:MAG: histidine kinase [Thermoplasmatales archaeon SW_10_69_26]
MTEDVDEEPPGSDQDEAMERRLAQSQALTEFTQRALKGMNLDYLLQQVCVAIVDVLETDYCDVFQLLPEKEQLILRAGVGWPEEYYDTKTLDTSPGSQSGYTVNTWEPTVVEDIEEDGRFRRPELFEEAEVRGGVTVTVPGPDVPWGVFGVHSREPRSFDQYDVTFVQSMGQVLSQAVQRARSERAIQDEKRRFESLLQEAEDYAIFSLNPEGHVDSWALGAERMMGYTEKEILGMHFQILYPEEKRREGRPMHDLQRALAQGGAEDEGWRIRKDGSRFWANVTINPYHDEEGNHQGFWKIVYDMTERVERERELERSERRYRALVENFPNGNVGIFDRDLTYRAVGGELFAEVGVDPEQRLGRSILEAYPEDIVEEAEEHFRAALAGEPRSFEVDFYGRHLQVRTVPLRDSEGDVFAGLVMAQDVTEREIYEDKLEESNQRLEQFAYAASHDLQEPLRMVTSYLELVDDRYGEQFDEEGREFMRHALDGAERMSRLIDSLLAYARVAGEGAETQRVDTQAVFEDALHDLEMHIQETGAEVVAEPLPDVEADPNLLAQVFRNLLSNALKYSGDEPPRVHVGADRAGDRWRFWVEDEGIGIEETDIDRIFDVFERVSDPRTDEEDQGAGVGLAICQQIVDRHGGEMDVESVPGEGSVFSFTMPAADTIEPPEPDHPGTEGASSAAAASE